MPKQLKSNVTPGKKPPAPSVKSGWAGRLDMPVDAEPGRFKLTTVSGLGAGEPSGPSR